jgi:hypothetical protein
MSGVGSARIDARTATIAHFSHNSLTGATQYALYQNSAGATRINAVTGQIITLGVNGAETMEVEAGLITIKQVILGNNANGVRITAGAGAATTASFIPRRTATTYGFGGDGSSVSLVHGGVAQLQTTAGGFDSLPDTDATFQLGRALIDSRTTDFMFLSHVDMTAGTQWALQQTSVGATAINTAGGTTLKLKVGNTNVATLTGTDITCLQHLLREVETGVVAGTTQTQAGATQLTADFSEVSTVGTTNDGVKLPDAVAGRHCTVFNNGANTLKLYPASGDNLEAGVDTATTLTAGSVITLRCWDTTNWKQCATL